MAEVYKGYQASLDRFVAIKMLHPFLADDPEFKDRFEREARNVARLRHPNIVQVYDFEYDDNNESFYMVMELIDGQTLKDRLTTLEERGESLGFDEILRISHGTGAALSYAHARGMIHRDVKPANLMIDSDGRIVLTDFGIAKIVTGIQFTASGGMVGTPAYMAPEQGLGDQGDERSDIYSLGVILFQLCTGQLPYDAESPLAVILKHLNESIPSPSKINPAISEALETVIYTAMAKDPEDRYQSADEMLRALDEATATPPSLTADTPRVMPAGSVANAIAQRAAARKTSQLKAVAAGATPPPPALVSGRRAAAGIAGFGGLAVILLVGAFLLGGGHLPFAAGATATATNTATPVPTLSATASPSVTSSPTATGTFTATATHTATPTHTATATASFTATFTATQTQTATPTFTLTPSATYTPSATATPSYTATPTVNLTATIQVATQHALDGTSTSAAQTIAAIVQTQIAQTTPTPNYTATALLCKPQYFLVSPKPPADKNPIKADSDFTVPIVVRNTGDCDWLPGTYLSYSSGESFNAPIKIIMDDVLPIPPNSEAHFSFKGHTPRKGGLYSGLWELRLAPDNKLVDPPLTIQFYAYE